MQYKSYLIEQNIGNLKENLVLFYGENIGLIDDFKSSIKKFYKDQFEIINFTQEDILKNNNLLTKEVMNSSLFDKKKILFIQQSDDKILKHFEELKSELNENKIYIFSSTLDKKSKLRNFFEKNSEVGIVPCYQDNEQSIKKIIFEKLKGYEGLSAINVNMIIENSGLERSKLNNELEKIKLFFNNKIIETEKLEILLNIKINEDFNTLKDHALLGNKLKTNKLLSETIIDDEKMLFYLNSLNQRLNKIKEVRQSSSTNIELSVNSLKPPIFWKDKPNFIDQTKKWTNKKIIEILDLTYKLEVQIKSNSIANKKILLKKLMIDVCELANS